MSEDNLGGGVQKFSEARRLVDMRKKANEEKQNAHSRVVLKDHIKTKFKTTMIGSLSKFEELFGDLWGHGLDEKDLDEDHLYWLERWQLVRDGILNNGNNQLRATLSEVDQYTVRFNKNEYKFLVRKNSQELTENE